MSTGSQHFTIALLDRRLIVVNSVMKPKSLNDVAVFAVAVVNPFLFSASLDSTKTPINRIVRIDLASISNWLSATQLLTSLG